jgi:hypothetical protein
MRFLLAVSLLFLSSCARLEPLTPELLQSAEQKWKGSHPPFYDLVVEMEGDRIERGRYDISVRGSAVTIRRDGQVVIPAKPQDYSMEGWFRMLHQELDLASNPILLGAPSGYSAYPMARFDKETGQLQKFQRTVGGTQNSIEIDVTYNAVGQR